MAAAFLGRVVQRRIQIAILLSMLVHLGVCWGMREYRLPVVQPDLLAKTEPIAMPPPATLPDYRILSPAERAKTDKKEEFEKPLATDLPDTKVPDVKRRAASAGKAQRAKKDDELASIQPKPIDVTRAEASAPRRADHLPGPERSRQQPARRVEPARIWFRFWPSRRPAKPKRAGHPDAADDVRRLAGPSWLASTARSTSRCRSTVRALQPELRGPQQPAAPRPTLASTAPLAARGLRPDLPASIPIRPELIGSPAAGSTPGPGRSGLARSRIRRCPQKANARRYRSPPANRISAIASQPLVAGLPGGPNSLAPRPRCIVQPARKTGEGLGSSGLDRLADDWPRHS